MRTKKKAVHKHHQNPLIDSTIKNIVLSMLLEANGKCVPQDEIVQRLRSLKHNSSRRIIRSTREALVKDGIPVCSSSTLNGLWIAQDETEKNTVADELESKAKTLLENAKALRKINIENWEKDWERKGGTDELQRIGSGQ